MRTFRRGNEKLQSSAGRDRHRVNGIDRLAEMGHILMIFRMSGDRDVPMVDGRQIDIEPKRDDGLNKARTGTASSAEQIYGVDRLDPLGPFVW